MKDLYRWGKPHDYRYVVAESPCDAEETVEDEHPHFGRYPGEELECLGHYVQISEKVIADELEAKEGR